MGNRLDGIAAVALPFLRVSQEAAKQLPRSLAIAFDALPLEVIGNELTVAAAEPSEELHNRLRFATGMNVRLVRADRDQIRKQLQTAYPQAELIDEASAVRALDQIHREAKRRRASDVHLEPAGDVRYRVNGVLEPPEHLHKAIHIPLVSRMKLLGGMDIAERRLPQDGAYSLEIDGEQVDVRISSIPTVNGERVAARFLCAPPSVPGLDSLGMNELCLEAYRRAIEYPGGFVVVCGPTGSGKTTTLYATIAVRRARGDIICSVEDPVEMRIENVAQVQVNQRAGLTFAVALRAFLRQDPNVIVVGEMRDAETAAIAVSAALSGQFVATTLHSADPCSAIERLSDFGIARGTLGLALSAIVSQRLVRTRCKGGCWNCRDGAFCGRTGIFEVMAVDEELREAIRHSAERHVMKAREAANPSASLWADGLSKVRSGVTTLDELRRVAAPK